MSTHARPLAERLAAASDAELEHLLQIRSVRSDADWDDFFDAAEALLEVPSIERGLAALGRDDARTLHEAVHDRADTERLRRLQPLGLADAQGRVLAPVAAVVASKPAVPDAEEASPAPASATSSAQAAERAFTTIGALAELLLAARTAPLALVATGALSATEKRRLPHLDDLDDLRELAEMAGLVRRAGRELRVTEAADAWLDAPFARRWAQVAASFRAALPPGIRSSDGWIPMPQWAQAHPWNPSWPARATHLTELAGRLGLFAQDGSEPVWSASLRRGEEVDASSLQTLLPVEVDRIFLQNDLTAIAPGPLLPALDNRLRSMSEHESAAQASSYRFTAESISRAFVEGETQESILDFLQSVSLTGVPQPLAYLVAQTASRHGLVRVGPDSDGDTVVSSADANLLQAIEIDRNLRPLGLVREGERLVTRVSAETVAWALTDARYPATLVDRHGAPVPASRRSAPEHVHEETPSHSDLIARLRSRRGPDADAAWLDRELEAAVRARAVVHVEVAMPDGSSRELTLEASGVGGGRLRGRDRAADVERTLPVRSIRAIRVLEG